MGTKGKSPNSRFLIVGGRTNLQEADRRKYPRFPCAAPARLRWSNTQIIDGDCLEVCNNGLRVASREAIPVSTTVSLTCDGLGLTGNVVVRYCQRDGSHFTLGLEFCPGLHWNAPDRRSSQESLSSGMTQLTAAIFDDLLSGTSAQELQPSVERLSEEERGTLLCTVACIQSTVAATCRERAAEIERMLAMNGQTLPPMLLPV